MALSKKAKIDVLGYFLSPKVKIIKKDDKEELLKRYNMTEAQMPVLLATDPLAENLKANPGDIVEIKRNDGTGEYLFYRIVV